MPAPASQRRGEEWIELPLIPERYLISTYGRVYRLSTRHFLTPRPTRHRNRHGEAIWVVSARRPDSTTVQVNLAYNVLRAFTGDPPPHHTVGYRDGNRDNFYHDNLFWRPWPGPQSDNKLARRQWWLTQRIRVGDTLVAAHLPDHVHGTQNAVDYYGCYCDRCRMVDRARRKIGGRE